VRLRFTQIALALISIFLLIIAAQPYIERILYASTTPRTVEPRGSLSDFEASTTALFERASPSVVQVAARPASGVSLLEDNPNRASSGTGFIWDGAGHVVTNDHVVKDSSQVAVRLSTGEVLQADKVGLAPTYDLAVIRIRVRDSYRLRSC
jgi:2-alkenal reductase